MEFIFKWLRNNKWIFLVLLYCISMYIQYRTLKYKFIITPGGIGLIIALVTTIFTNSRPIKRLYRKAKYFFGPTMFKWEATSSFDVREINFKNVRNEENSLIDIVKKALKNNNLNYQDKHCIDTAYDRLNHLKIFIREYVMYLDISVANLNEQDDDGYSLNKVTIKTHAALRYKDRNKAINGLLLDIYYYFEDKYKPYKQKYTVKLNIEGMSKDFLKRHFIQEYNPDEIQTFTIRCNHPRATEEVTSDKLTLTTSRREELGSAINKLILRIS